MNLKRKENKQKLKQKREVSAKKELLIENKHEKNMLNLLKKSALLLDGLFNVRASENSQLKNFF